MSRNHPQEYIELRMVNFSDENDGCQNGTPMVQFTSIDTVNRFVSGTFESINANDGNNPPTYHNLTNGVFTNIPY